MLNWNKNLKSTLFHLLDFLQIGKWQTDNQGNKVKSFPQPGPYLI